MAEPALSLEGVSHRYGGLEALKEVSFSLPAGSMTALIGPDGAGKSTLLGLVAGARRLQEGAVTVLGGDMASKAWRDRVCPRIAYMPQGLGRNLYMDLTVRENLVFFGRLFGQDRAERDRRIAELLRATGLDPFPDRPAGKLSGGMKQKLGLCCALIHDPDLLILDEPTTGVDPLSRRQFWELIATIRARRPGMSLLVATAYMEEAEGFDHLVAMDRGRVLAEGSAEALKARGGAESLEAAFVALLPEERRGRGGPLEIPPRQGDGGPPVIQARDLTLRFGNFTAVDRVSFEIERGEIFGFLGSNGCGKTTTMKMLTGLLPPSEGEAVLLGASTRGQGIAIRRRVGYMSQSFSLYAELTVRQNLELHARLFSLPAERVALRVAELLERFGLEEQADALAEALPLGLRQRLSLAVAVIHEPEMLILDEPTSGVDPVARDAFWALLVDLSRNQGVTIFISTHFMNEAARCDRISLMHEGRVLASGSPGELAEAKGGGSLEEAFIAYLVEAERGGAAPAEAPVLPEVALQSQPSQPVQKRPQRFALRRLLAYSRREGMEIWRDPVRLAFAVLGTTLLMLVFGYGITFDVEDLRYAVLDHDRTPGSRRYVEGLAGSRYFREMPPLASEAEMDLGLRSGEITLALEIPEGFGRELLQDRRPAVAAWIDGAMPFRAETAGGYLQGLHQGTLATYARELGESAESLTLPADLEPRFRYNQAFQSIYAIVPNVIGLMLLFVPSVLMALGVVREKELGSITNLYVTPVSRLEFLLGKQLPYVAIGLGNYLLLLALAVLLFQVPVKGSLAALSLGALLYVVATTGLGLLISAFTRTQIAALFATAISTMLPAVQFSGMMQPVSSLEGAGYLIGQIFPTSYFMTVSVGAFTKALGFGELWPDLLVLAAFFPILTLLSLLLLRKQEA